RYLRASGTSDPTPRTLRSTSSGMALSLSPWPTHSARRPDPRATYLNGGTMSERMAAQIEIGGELPADLVPELIDEIKAQGVQVGWNETSFNAKNAKELLALARRNGKRSTLLLADHEVTWGSFDCLEAFLVRHAIAFNRHSEGKFGFDAEL